VDDIRARHWHRRAAASITAGCLLLAALLASSGPAAAEPLVQRTVRQRARLERTIDQVRGLRSANAKRITRQLAGIDRSLRRVNAVSSGRADRSGRKRRQIVQLLVHERGKLQAHLRHTTRWSTGRVTDLVERREAIDAWLATWGVFRTCPVRSPLTDVADNFGVIVRVPKAPVHVHQGNDISAPTGAPIVAPFDGTAVATSNELGGLAVKVYGERGYVYNAHLSAYGTLGAVRAGTIIGYVGSTGDATGPHDHFEWHPGGGAAVDPNPLLMVVC